MRPVTFLSDYGYDDEFAGVCRAVIAREAPGVTVIDITHGIPPHDVRAGALALARSLPYTPVGVHLAVVDPGVGTGRRPVAVRVADGDRVLVGPDNGLLAPAIRRSGGAVEAVDLSEAQFGNGSVSATFHGRDLFAPAAARIAAGDPLGCLGFHFSPESLIMPPEFEPFIDPHRIRAHVIGIDRYGNTSLDLTASALARHPVGAASEVTVKVGNISFGALRGRKFADAAIGELVFYEDAGASMALAVNRGNAAAKIGVPVGAEIVLWPA